MLSSLSLLFFFTSPRFAAVAASSAAVAIASTRVSLISRLEYTERTCCGSNYTNTSPEPSCLLDGGDNDGLNEDSSDSRGEVVRKRGDFIFCLSL